MMFPNGSRRAQRFFFLCPGIVTGRYSACGRELQAHSFALFCGVTATVWHTKQIAYVNPDFLKMGRFIMFYCPIKSPELGNFNVEAWIAETTIGKCPHGSYIFQVFI